MTLQQLEYIVALDEHRHFGRAAEACHITQSTLSSMIHKLEEELDIVVFDRSQHPVEPTTPGRALLKQARLVLREADQLREITLSEQRRTSGVARIGFTPTIAPYVVPDLIHYIDTLPDVEMHASEVHRDKIVKRLRLGQLDMGIMSLRHPADGLLEIPLYRERIMAYVSPKDPLFDQAVVDLSQLPYDRLWAIHNEYSFESDECDNYAYKYARVPRYSSGDITTLLNIVNRNDGFTLIPELHVPMLYEEDKRKVRAIVNHEVSRQVSLYVREDYVHEGLLNVIVDGIKSIIPESMIDARLRQYAVRLR